MDFSQLLFPSDFVVKHFLYLSEKHLRRKYLGFHIAFFAVLLPLLISGGSGAVLAQDSGRPRPALLPDARPDAALAEVGKPVRIEILANDVGVPSEGTAPELRIEGVPTCATVQIDGRALIFRGGADCVGADVVFGYGVKLQGDWLTAAVSVTVKPAAPAALGSCDLPDYDWRMTKIEGGSFDKSSAPPGIVDFVELIDENTFTVAPFCITLEALPAEPVDRYFNNLAEADRRDQYPEMAVQSNIPIGQATPGRMPANASERMAVAFAKRTSERSNRQLDLPTLQEYVAAAWELQTRRRGAPETDAFLITMRNGNLQWSSTPCGSSGSYWTIGPSIQGKLVKLCYELSRLDRTGFRLAIRQ